MVSRWCTNRAYLLQRGWANGRNESRMIKISWCRTSLIAVILCASALGQSLPSNIVQRIDAIVEQARAAQKLPAVSVAVEVKGHVLFKKAYGFADLENSLAATPESLFRTGSIAKPMTAVAAMKLVQQGKLDLDVPVQRY